MTKKFAERTWWILAQFRDSWGEREREREREREKKKNIYIYIYIYEHD